MRWEGRLACVENIINAYRILVRISDRWEDNIKMDLREVGWGGAWTGSIWFRIGTGGELL
jgi:hypothetical protein